MAQLIYFSLAGPTWTNGTVVNQPIGNTARLAQLIGQQLALSPVSIRVKPSYPCDYSALETRAQAEITHWPTIVRAPKVQSTIIYLGYPIWFGDVPPAVKRWLTSVSASFELRPFVTHEGSGVGRSLQSLQTLVPQAKMTSSLAVRGGRVDRATVAVNHWLLGFE